MTDILVIWQQFTLSIYTCGVHGKKKKKKIGRLGSLGSTSKKNGNQCSQ